MNIILYESGSRGGNFDYSRHLFEVYRQHPDVKSVEWIIPSVADVAQEDGITRILCDDRRYFRFSFFSRLNFVYRSFVNPLILFWHLRSYRDTRFVVMNDFEQLTALLWVPLYKKFLNDIYFSVVLHDPDRDAYPPSRAISVMSMKKLMSIMTFAFFHEKLPNKPYYKSNQHTIYHDVPHGQYDRTPRDEEMSGLLDKGKNGFVYVSIIGNIRAEKNYEVAIRAMSKVGRMKLIIAGSPANSTVDVDVLKRLATDLGVADRVVFVLKYLSASEMASVIEASEVILLNYKPSFTSQSGVLNLIAPYKKRVVISRTESGLSHIASRFNLGYSVQPDSVDDLVAVLSQALNMSTRPEVWHQYLRYASWENHVNIVVNAFKKVAADAV